MNRIFFGDVPRSFSGARRFSGQGGQCRRLIIDVSTLLREVIGGEQGRWRELFQQFPVLTRKTFPRFGATVYYVEKG